MDGQLSRDGISNTGNSIGNMGGLTLLLGVCLWVHVLLRVDWGWGWCGRRGPDDSCWLLPNRM